MPRFIKGSPAAKAQMAKIRKAKQTGTSNKKIDRTKQAKPVGKRTSASGKIYYETRANRSDKGKLLGVDNPQFDYFTKDVLKDFEYCNKQILIYENIATIAKFGIQNEKMATAKAKLKSQLIKINSYLKELKQHKTELKKLM